MVNKILIPTSSASMLTSFQFSVQLLSRVQLFVTP